MAGAAAIPDNPDEVPDAPADTDSDVEVEGGEFSEVQEIADQASEYVASEESDEDPEEKAEKRAAAKKAGDKSEARAKVDKEQEKAAKAEGSRAQKRIQELSARAKAAEARAEQREREFQQWQGQASQREREAEKRYYELEKQHAVAAREMELVRQREEQAQEAQLDPLEKAMRIERRKALAEAESKIRGEYDPKLTQMEQRYQQMQQHLEKQREEGEIKERINGYSQKTDQAVAELLNGLAPERTAQLHPDIRTHVLNWAAATGTSDLRAAAKEFDRVAHAYVLSKQQLKNKANVIKAEAGKKIPPALPSGRRIAKGQGSITHAQARKAGYGSALEALVQQNPPGWAGR